MNFKVPSIEEIYDCYHRETFFAQRSFYPKSIKNFNKILTPEKTELLKKFQKFIIRNQEMVDWKLYVKACASYFKRNFDLKVLGSLNANKIYRTYVEYVKIGDSKTPDQIYDEVISSLKFLKEFIADNRLTFKDYFYNRDDIIPVIIRHLYAGTVSFSFYACLDPITCFKIFQDIPDDVFFEMFKCSRNDFLQFFINDRRQKMICMSKVLPIINKLEGKFKSL